VDLFAAEGPLPRNLLEALEREKDIRYASRTRHNTQRAMETHNARMALRELLTKLPEELRNEPNAVLLGKLAKEHKVTVAQLVYKNKPFEGSSKDYEFSRQAMIEHWQAGHGAVEHCMAEHADKLRCRPEGATLMLGENQEKAMTS